MKQGTCGRCILVALMAILALDASAQSRLPPGVDEGGAPMATRSVSLFLGLERALVDALQTGRRDSAAPMLGANFEVFSAEKQNATPGSEWLTEQLRGAASGASVRDLGVREFGEFAVVSFLLDRAPNGRSASAASTLYVVDVWQQANRTLEVRYISRPRQPPRPPPRPSGRE